MQPIFFLVYCIYAPSGKVRRGHVTPSGANDDPEPAIASTQQAQRRKYRLEFELRTYCYEAD